LIKENAVTRLKQSLPKLEIKWGDDDASDDSDASDASDDADDSNDDAAEIIHTISYDVDADLDANTGEYNNEIIHTIVHDDLVVSTALSEEMESTSGIDVNDDSYRSCWFIF
jgi:hypothetical protein